MKGNVFQNRWGALSFVGVTLIAAVVLVGTESVDGTLAEATAQIEQQSAEQRDRTTTINSAKAEPGQSEKPAAQPSATPTTPPTEDIFEFTSDEDLQVDPVGIDPTPIIEDPFVEDPTAGEVIEVKE